MNTIVAVPPEALENITYLSTAGLIPQLRRILDAVRAVSPRDARISFDFDGRLYVHIDVRLIEEVAALQAILPTLDLGFSEQFRRGATPHHRFLHRISAMLDG